MIDLKALTATKSTPECQLRNNPKRRCLYVDLSTNLNSIDTWSRDRINSLKRSLQKETSLLIFHGDFKNPLAAENAEYSKRALSVALKEADLAREFGAFLILHPSTNSNGTKPIKTTKCQTNFLLNLDSLSKRYEGKLWIENMPYLPQGSMYEAVFSHFDSIEYILNHTSVGFIFDVGHAFVGQTGSFDRAFSLFSRAKALSIHDNHGVVDQHLTPGNGSIPYARVFSHLRENSWSGPIIFDCVDIDNSTPIDILSMYKVEVEV